MSLDSDLGAHKLDLVCSMLRYLHRMELPPVITVGSTVERRLVGFGRITR